MSRLFFFVLIIPIVFGQGQDACDPFQLQMCFSPLASVADTIDKTHLCRVLKQVLESECLKELMSCTDQNIRLQVKQFKDSLTQGVKQCSGCTMTQFLNCTQLRTTINTRNESYSNCQVWWRSKACLLTLSDDCKDGDEIKNLTDSVLDPHKTSGFMPHCDSYITCTDDKIMNCMTGLGTVSSDYEKCLGARKAQHCIHQLTRASCEEPVQLMRARYFLGMLKIAERDACYGDGDGEGPNVASSQQMMFLLLGTMFFVAMVYN